MIIAGVVSLGGLLFGWNERTRTLADLEAARGLVDDGAIVLQRIAYVLDEVGSDLTSKLEDNHAKLGELGHRHDELPSE